MDKKEFELFCELSQKAKVPMIKTVMGDVVLVRMIGFKFYADNE